MNRTIATPSRTIVQRTYDLTSTNGRPIGCTCPGFQYRGKCRHLVEHTDGGFLVYCTGCMRDLLNAVTYSAARQFAQTADYRSACCGQDLATAPDFEARAARHAA